MRIPPRHIDLDFRTWQRVVAASPHRCRNCQTLVWLEPMWRKWERDIEVIGNYRLWACSADCIQAIEHPLRPARR